MHDLYLELVIRFSMRLLNPSCECVEKHIGGHHGSHVPCSLAMGILQRDKIKVLYIRSISWRWRCCCLDVGRLVYVNHSLYMKTLAHDSRHNALIDGAGETRLFITDLIRLIAGNEKDGPSGGAHYITRLFFFGPIPASAKVLWTQLRAENERT